jgi:uncharacterized lipoprotein YajG
VKCLGYLKKTIEGSFEQPYRIELMMKKHLVIIATLFLLSACGGSSTLQDSSTPDPTN